MSDAQDSGPDEPQDGESRSPVLFYFDFSSPYAYLAAHRIDDMARLYGREVDWRPFLVGAIYKQSGAAALLDQPYKGAYSKRDMSRCARLMGLPLVFPEAMPFASVPAARATFWAKDIDEAHGRRLARALLDAAFARGEDIRGIDEVVAVASAIGLDGAALQAALGEPALKTRLREEVDAAMAAGVCGSPFFFVDGEPFWGADRLDHVEQWLATGGW